jgi:alpha-beta hydrolase superfamily lysophospholipase
MPVFQVDAGESYLLKGKLYQAEKPIGNLVCFTGMDEHSSRYDSFAEALNHKGITVYVLDHFGQGLNARSVEEQEIMPRNGFGMEVEGLYQTVLLAKKSGLPVYLMGHSYGSFLVQAYLEEHPDTVKKVILCGSNGRNNAFSIRLGCFISHLRTGKKNWEKQDKLMGFLSFYPYQKSVRNARTEFDWLSYNEKNVEAYMADPYCGHYNTHGFFYEMMGGMKKMYTKKRRKLVSGKENIYILSGKDDPVGAMGKGALSLEKMYRKLGVSKVRSKIYPNMRHEILNEDKKDEVIQDIADFLLG